MYRLARPSVERGWGWAAEGKLYPSRPFLVSADRGSFAHDFCCTVRLGQRAAVEASTAVVIAIAAFVTVLVEVGDVMVLVIIIL